MSNPKFAETHNLVAFLEKPEESDGFEGIIDFLNASSIIYALTVNPVDGKKIQALVDGKKVIVTETSVRRALHLKDAEGTDCLPTATIFAELERIGYEKLKQKLTFYKAFFSPQWKFLIHTILQCLSAKTTAWNEFSSTMASAIICLATNQNFNFSKYIFDNMVKNLEGGVKFLMYPRFVQVFLDKQVKGMSKYKETYATPSHTKKVFAHMKREGKGFSCRDTPLFPTMMVQAQQEEGEGLAIPTDPHPTPSITQPSLSQPEQKQKPRRKQRKGIEIPSSSGKPIVDEAANEEHIPTHSNDPLLSGKDRLKLNELMEICTNIQKKVLDLETSTAAQVQEISSLKHRVKKLEKKKKSRPHGLRMLYKVGSSKRVKSSEGGLGAQEDASKHGRKIVDLDADAEKPIPVRLRTSLNTAGEVVTTASVEILDELTLAQTLIEIKTAKPKAITTVATTVTPVRPRAKGSEKEVAIDAIPLATKPPTNKDLETLWKLVKAKYRNTRPEEVYEKVLWGDLKVMFKPDVEISAADYKVTTAEKITTAEKGQ
ncbi:hypothetical protein Tco_0494187 [Tanacetum coccineum]